MISLSKLNNQEKRRKFIEKMQNIKLKNIKKMDEDEVIHCENLIGSVSLPIGIAGPIKIIGNYVRGKYYVPIATTEGALVASISRGGKAISQSFGANIQINREGTTRGPVFYTGSIRNGKKFSLWIEKNIAILKTQVKKTSNHIELIKYSIELVGQYAYMRLYFNTEEAMGMNMATIATDNIAKLIEIKTAFRCISIAGNFDIDKKPAWLNFIQHRGYRVMADAVIKSKILKEVCKVESDKVFDVWLSKCMIGSALAGSLGFNAHFANIVAAFYVATGQDLAHVVEGSMGITTTKVLDNKDLYISVYLPAVMMGTVGGGTKLKAQSEVRSIIGIKRTEELVEVLASAVLAGELSLLSSLAKGTLAQSHKKLGR